MTLEQRVQHLELELRKARPSASSDAPALMKRISALESEIARLKSSTPTKPAVYTPAPAPVVAKPADKSLATKVTALEREIERLKVKESPGAWVNWTPTLTGWTESLPAGGVYRYCRIGKLVMLRIGMSGGTSNATVASMTIPFSNYSAQVNGTIGFAMNAGTWLTGACRWNIPGGGTSVNFYTDMAYGTWTASGGKRVYAVVTYEAA